MPAPPASVVAWVERAVGDRLLDAAELPQHRATGPWILTLTTGRRLVLHLGDDRDPTAAAHFATERAALALAATHGLAAPVVAAADADGSKAGALAMLTTVLPGSSRIPSVVSPARSRAFGRSMAAIHAVSGTPSDDLPRRRRSLEGIEFGSDVDPGPPPATAAAIVGLVHGDLWQGNTLWDGDRHCGTIDWDFAGFGPPGIDLGTVRFDAALFHGMEAADDVLRGWEEAMGRPAADQPYWDLLAAACSPPDLAAWLPNFHAQGRADLDLATVAERRRRFVEAAS